MKCLGRKQSTSLIADMAFFGKFSFITLMVIFAVYELRSNYV